MNTPTPLPSGFTPRRPHPDSRPYGRARTAFIPLRAACAADARLFATATLADWNATAAVTAAVVLVVSELVTNAFRHAERHGAPPVVPLRLRGAGDRIEVTVWDPDPRMPEPCDAAPGPRWLADSCGAEAGEGGYGLRLVDWLTHGYTVHPDGCGKAVTAAVAAPGHGCCLCRPGEPGAAREEACGACDREYWSNPVPMPVAADGPGGAGTGLGGAV